MPEPITRRTLLIGSASAATLAALGVTLGATPVFAAAPPTTAADTVALAQSLVGKTLYQLQASPMVESPWHSYAYEWCAVFTSWLLRGVGSGDYLTYASDQYAAYPSVSSPLPGDIIYYPDPGHVGLVVSTSGGITTVEGNVPGVHWSQSLVKSYSPPWRAGYLFSRPPYSTAAPVEQGESMAVGFTLSGTGTRAIAGLGVGDAAWIESTDAALMTALAIYMNGKSFVTVSQANWDMFKAKFTAPVEVTVV